MKKLLTIAMALFVTASAFAATITVTEGVIESNETWTNDNIYVLEGFVAINDGVVLTIEEGTIIKGDKATKGTLIVMRGGKLVAEGSDCNPVVFTSNEPAGSRAIGDWGGVIVLGRAPINVPGGVTTIEGGVPNTLVGKTTGNTIVDVNQYGGSNVTDNSGILNYVRIEYCGIAFSLDNEINGLTMGGVGSGTLIDYVQVSFCGDDSFEWFGGTVNCKHLIAWRGTDDDWDSDFGFSGDVQYGLGVRDANIADAAGSSNGFESNNDGDGSSNTPLTTARFVNMTEVGPIQNPGDVISPFFRRGIHKRGNSNATIANSIVMGYNDGIELDACNGTDTKVSNNIFAGNGVTYDCDVCPPCVLPAGGDGNIDLALTSLVGLTDAYNTTAPDFRPTAGSLPLVATDLDGLGGTIDEVEYLGAFDGMNDWTEGWAEFDPQTADYSVEGAVNNNPTATLDMVTDATACDNGAISITPAGGTGTYSFAWSNGASTDDVAGLAPGSYSVDITSGGCTATENYLVANNLAAPSGLSSTAGAGGSEVLSWNPVSGSVACRVTGGPSGGGAANLNVIGFETTGTTVPGGVLSSGTTYDWFTTCACSLSPLVLTPSSAVNSFVAASPRIGETAVNAKLFPNPAENNVFVNYDAAVEGEVEIRVVNVTGQVVVAKVAGTMAGMNVISVDLTDVAAGQYFVEVAGETMPLVVE